MADGFNGRTGSDPEGSIAKEKATMGDVVQFFFDKPYEQQGPKELVDAPVDALQGLSQSDADALKQALGIETVRELAENKFVRIAQAVVILSR